MKKYRLSVLVLLFLLLTFSNTTEAKLVIISPQDMIDQSGLIVIGYVTQKKYSEEERQVVISVETIVKGETEQKEISFKRNKPPMYGWLGFDFPEKGTRIMVLLQQNDQLTLTGDANAVAVLDDNNVSLYKGITMGQFTPENYEDTYKSYLDAHSSLITSDKMLKNTSIILGSIVVSMFFIFGILKRKRQN
jgi:hypothetical protein